MNAGHTHGLKIACGLNPAILTKALIDNCGTTEQDMDDLMEGFAQLEVLRSLVIRRSVIGRSAIPHLSTMFEKIFPSNLATLKIERCQISKEATLLLVRSLQEKCYIRTLALVGVSFDQESIREMCAYLVKKPYVEDLDLSNNRVNPKLFLLLLEALSTLTTLKSLNLSWNLLLENARGPQIGTYVKEENIVYGRANEPIEYPPPLNDTSKESTARDN